MRSEKYLINIGVVMISLRCETILIKRSQDQSRGSFRLKVQIKFWQILWEKCAIFFLMTNIFITMFSFSGLFFVMQKQFQSHFRSSISIVWILDLRSQTENRLSVFVTFVHDCNQFHFYIINAKQQKLSVSDSILLMFGVVCKIWKPSNA